MANKFKGELEVSLGGKKLTLRPTFEALVEIEDKAGVGLSSILRNFSKAEWTLKQVAAVIYGGLSHLKDSRSGLHTYPFEVVGELIVAHGMKDYLQPAVMLLSKAVAPDAQEEGEGESEKKDEAGSNP